MPPDHSITCAFAGPLTFFAVRVGLKSIPAGFRAGFATPMQQVVTMSQRVAILFQTHYFDRGSAGSSNACAGRLLQLTQMVTGRPREVRDLASPEMAATIARLAAAWQRRLTQSLPQ